MDEVTHFDELIRRVRGGDEAAAAEVVRRYEPFIRRAARNRLAPHLRRVLDSLDVCQSVLASLFRRARDGQYQLDSPEQLQKLLARMVRNKVTDLWRRYEVRVLGVEGERPDPIAADDTPDVAVALREILTEVRRRLGPEERPLLELREQNEEWAAIAAQRGGSAEALRKQLARAIERVATEMGLRE